MGAPFRIETRRLILRDWRAEDWPEFFRVTNTPAVMEWLGGVLGDEGQAQQRARVEACHAANGFCFWAVERKADSALLGFCGLKRADAPGSSVSGEMEVGWRFREDSWRQGFAKEAAVAAIDAGFAQFGADEIIALTLEGNTPSWGLMKRLGMRRRPELDYADARYDPPWRDTVVYSISHADWRGA